MEESTINVSYVGRMYQEMNELNARIGKAKAAILHVDCTELERFLLLEQLERMVSYAAVLGMRIAGAEKTQ